MASVIPRSSFATCFRRSAPKPDPARRSRAARSVASRLPHDRGHGERLLVAEPLEALGDPRAVLGAAVLARFPFAAYRGDFDLDSHNRLSLKRDEIGRRVADGPRLLARRFLP